MALSCCSEYSLHPSVKSGTKNTFTVQPCELTQQLEEIGNFCMFSVLHLFLIQDILKWYPSFNAHIVVEVHESSA